MSHPLNGQYHCRPVTMDDLPAAVDLFNAESRWLIGSEQSSVDDVRAEWESPEINLPTDTLAVFTAENQPVGYVEFWGNVAPYVRLFGWVSVHPDYHSQGIGTYLAGWLVERSRQNVHLAPQDARVILEQGINARNTGAAGVLSHHSFEVARHFYHMRIDLEQAPTVTPPPDGILIRSIANDEELTSAMRATYDSFHDHWGWVDQPFEDYCRRWKYRLETNKDYDPSLYFIALDGNEVAGVSLCYPKMHEDPEMAWVGTLGVRRPWRKRGLGQALLQHSFAEFYRRGKQRAGLGVDATSLTGATRLYERAGMYVFREFNVFTLELQSGKDLITQNVED